MPQSIPTTTSTRSLPTRPVASSKKAPVVHAPRKVASAIQAMMNVSICSVTKFYADGKLAWLQQNGIDLDLVARVRHAEFSHVNEACEEHAQRLSDSGNVLQTVDIDTNRIMRDIVRKMDSDRLQRAFINLGASNTLVANLFGMRSMEAKALRELAKFEGVEEHYPFPKLYEQASLYAEIFDLVVELQSETSCDATIILEISRRKKVAIDYVAKKVDEIIHPKAKQEQTNEH